MFRKFALVKAKVGGGFKAYPPKKHPPPYIQLKEKNKNKYS